MTTSLAITEADGFAISMLAILALSLGTVALILVAILRQRGKAASDLEDLAQNREATPAKPAAAGKASPATEPWEKDADWWRKS